MQLGVIAERPRHARAFFDVVKKLPLGNAQQVDTPAALLAGADVVSACTCPSPRPRTA
jgi:ornithine cyclodeaminase/alanine dehydrogenase-like protein (mu-crystallin family)